MVEQTKNGSYHWGGSEITQEIQETQDGQRVLVRVSTGMEYPDSIVQETELRQEEKAPLDIDSNIPRFKLDRDSESADTSSEPPPVIGDRTRTRRAVSPRKDDESAEKTIVREMKEETGLNAVKYKYMCSRYHEPKNVLMLGFIVVISDGDISVNQDEIEDVKWCSFDEAIETVKEDTTAGFFLKNAVAELKRNKI